MGQCSILPEGNQQSSEEHETMSLNQSKHRAFGQSNTSSHSKKHIREQRDSSYYGRPGDDDTHRHNDGDVMMGDSQAAYERVSYDKMSNAKRGGEKLEPIITDSAMVSPHYQTPPGSAKSSRRHHQVHPAPSPIEVAPKIPDGAVRTRCYRLNLDAPVVLSPTHDKLGPFPYEPPAHLLPTRVSSKKRSHSLRSVADDRSVESIEKTTTQVAIDTARIFRGITVDKNGVILSQNARASRSSKGRDKSKQGEKSRQAAKIDKAKDLVDEAISNAGKENDGEKSNMVSLSVVGEYDDMKQLVRDGAKKLRDAEDLPDEALLGINRIRSTQQNRNPHYSSSSNGSMRKRISSPFTPTGTSDSTSRSRSRSKSRQVTPQSNPPKLKGHPRDRPSSRRMSATAGVDTTAEKQSRCSDVPLFGGGDGDWSGALKGFNSIWNCGGTGNNAVSPTNITTNSANGGGYDNRNESSTRISHGDDTSARRDAPGGKDVVIM